MKILFLGTGAADWTHLRTKEEVYYRRYSSVLIDDTLIIDPGPKVIEAIEEFGVNLKKIKFILNTHNHWDHYSDKTVDILKDNGAQFIDIPAGKTLRIGPYSVRAVKGNHAIETCHYIVDDGENKVFYGMDGAWLLYDEFQAIIENAPINLAVLDATIGFQDGDYRIFEHNNLNMVIELQKSVSPYVDRFCISHLAYTLHDDHTSLSRKMEEHGIITAYDGLIVSL